MSFKSVFVLFLVSSISFQVNSKLLISPTRVVFEENERTEEIVLINTSTQELTYRLAWVDKFALPDGGYQDAEEAGQVFEHSASDMIRFSPRQVRLKPGERQLIKLLARRSSSNSKAEYRSHLKFIVIPPDAIADDLPTEGISMQLNLFMNYTIPVMLRTAENNAEIKITAASLRKRPDSERVVLDVSIERKGDTSFLANFEVYQKGTGPEPIGRLNAVNFFSELNKNFRGITLTGYDQNAPGELVIRAVGAGEYLSATPQEFVLRQ